MKINALTLDLQADGWSSSRGFIKRTVPRPILDETVQASDATAVIIKVQYAGVCGSDRGIWNRVAFSEMVQQSLEHEQKSLRILGHEFVGAVIQAGSMVQHLYGITVGNTVSGDSHVTCGRCYQCRLGEAEVCQDQAILGISTDGIFAQYVKIPAKNLWPVDLTRVRPEVCAVYDPFGNAVHALTKVDVRGARVAIFGCGQIGLFAILLARHFGAAKVIGVDTNAANLAMAKTLGAHEVIHLQPTEKMHDYDADAVVLKQIQSLTHGKGVDVSLEMAGFNSSVNNCLAATRFGGHIILFGIKDGDFTIPGFSRMIVKGLTIHNIIGRQIFYTWQIAQRVMSDKSNGIQDSIWEIILKQGNGTIITLSDFAPDIMEQKMAEHPKLLFDMQP
ncbi:MAG: alcohol dehydrogenase catalytic domain-containing protein [Candidatus Kerfeldbacteria bacterium]|nr:alcohol dehydrogenase catalytic domain-containing protein [Candidatus Kerfeldbacteria bacterium]